MSLRVRLVLSVIVVAAIGLAVADVATYTSLRSFLIHRTDTTLSTEHTSIENAVLQEDGHDGGGPAPAIPPGDYVEVRKLDGTVLYHQLQSRFGQPTPSPPRLPKTFAFRRSRQPARIGFATSRCPRKPAASAIACARRSKVA